MLVSGRHVILNMASKELSSCIIKLMEDYELEDIELIYLLNQEISSHVSCGMKLSEKRRMNRNAKRNEKKIK
jgi:hypothetical protein